MVNPTDIKIADRPAPKARKVLMNRAIREALDYELGNDPTTSRGSGLAQFSLLDDI